jgi:hypothetical protein
LQELAEGVATDLGIDKTVVRELGVDSFANLVLGAIGGGAPGGVRGAISRDKTQAPPAAPEVAPTVTPVTPETPPSDAAAAAVPPVPQAPVSGAIGDTELETAEDRTAPTAAINEVMMPIVDVDGNVTDKMDKIDLNNVFVEDGAIWVAGEDYDHDLNSVLEELTDETQKADLIKRAEALQPKATETTEPSVAQKNLDELLSGKEENIKQIAANYGVSPEYAEKAFNAEKELREAKVKYHTPELINSPEYAAAVKKHQTFFNRLKAQAKKPAGKIELTPEDYAAIDRSLSKNYEERNEEDEAALDKGADFIKENIETIEAPPFKKGYGSSAKIKVAPFKDGYVASGTYMGSTGGYGSSPHPVDTVYPTKQEAINAEIDNMRNYALSYEDPKALVWLSSIDPRIEKITEAEAKRQVNVYRQEVKKTRDKEYEEKQKLVAKWYPILQKYGWDGIGDFNNEVMLTTEDQFIKDHGEDALQELYDKDIVGVHEPILIGQLKKVGEQYEDTRIVWVDFDTVPESVRKSKEYQDRQQAKYDAESEEEVDQDVSEAEEETETASYQLEKDPSATKIESPDGRVKIFLRQITETDPKNYEGKSLTGQWLSDNIYKTPDGGSYGPGKTPKSSPITFNSKDEALKSAIEYIQFLNEKADKKGNSDTKAMQFLDELAAKNGITIETRAEKKAKSAEETKAAKAEANRKRQEEKKAKAAEDKKSAKEKEKEETARLVKSMQDQQARKLEEYANKAARTKELEDMSRVEKEFPEDYQKADLKELQAALDKASNKYRVAARNYIDTGKGRDEIVKANDEVNKATEAYNKVVLEGLKEEEAPKAEVKKEPKAEVKEEAPKSKALAALPLDQSWAANKFKEPSFSPSEDGVKEIYNQFKEGTFDFQKISFSGPQAIKRANEANKELRKDYDKAAREFLGHEITTKAPTKNQPKIDADTNLNAVPAPIAKAINP